MQDKSNDEDKYYNVRDISKKMDMLFMYYCPKETSISGKSKILEEILLQRALVLMPDRVIKNKDGSFKPIISSRTLYQWATEDNKHCEKEKIRVFTELLRLKLDTFVDQSPPPFFRNLIHSQVTISHVFKKFEKANFEDWRKLRGFYFVYYSTPDNKIAVSLLLIIEAIKYYTPLKFCCIFDDSQKEYTGLWAFENGAFYAYFEGPTQDGVSTIIANLPSIKSSKSAFEGILLSRDMKDSLGSPFSTKVVIIPLLVGKMLDKHLSEKNETYYTLWKRLKVDIPEIIPRSDLKNKVGEALYDIICDSFSTRLVAYRELTDNIGQLY